MDGALLYKTLDNHDVHLRIIHGADERESPHPQLAEVQRYPVPGGYAAGDQAATPLEAGLAVLPDRGADVLEDQAHALASGKLQDALRKLRHRLVVDHLVRAQGFGLLQLLVRAGGGDDPSSPSEDYLAVLAGQRQWIATTNFAGCPGQPQIALRIAPCSLPRQSS